MTPRELTKECIKNVILREDWTRSEGVADGMAEAILKGLDALLEAQEGFVPVSKTSLGGKSDFDSATTEIESESFCLACAGAGGFRTDPLFGDGGSHLAPCETCNGTGHPVER